MVNTPINRERRHGVAELTAEPTPLVPLSQVEGRPRNEELDIRGFLMYGSDGQVMGRVEELLLEADQRTADRGLPLFQVEYAVVRFTDEAGIREWILVPMAAVKETIPEERKVIVRGPARELCEAAYPFHQPDEISPADEEEIYAFWEVEPRWRRRPNVAHKQVVERR